MGIFISIDDVFDHLLTESWTKEKKVRVQPASLRSQDSGLNYAQQQAYDYG